MVGIYDISYHPVGKYPLNLSQKQVWVWGFFFCNCSGEFQTTAPGPWGAQKGTDWTIAVVTRTSVVMNISLRPQKVSSTKRKANGCSQQKKRQRVERRSPWAAMGRMALPRHGCFPPMGRRDCIALAQTKKSLAFPAWSFPSPLSFL